MTVERVGAESFEGGRLKRPGTWAVGFVADWCPFCAAFEPEFARLTEGASFGALEADVTSLSSPLWDRFDVEVVPTVVIFRDGEPVFRVDGVHGEGLSRRQLRAVEEVASAAAAATTAAPKGGG